MEFTQHDLDIQDRLLSHPRNKRIEFQESPYHRYLLHDEDGQVTEYEGITSLIKQYAPFNRKAILHAVANKRSKIEGRRVTTDEIAEEWKQARDQGTAMHNDLESWGQTGTMPDRPAAKKAVHWLTRKGFRPIAFEFVMYDERLGRATAVDLMCVDQKDRLVPMDYKTSKEIRKRPYFDGKGNEKYMEYPLTHLPTANFFQYSIQTTLPIKWLEELYFPDGDVQVSHHGWILHVRNGEFNPVPALYLGPDVQRLYNWETQLQNNGSN